MIINSAIGIIGLLFHQEELVQQAVYGEYGLLYQLEHGVQDNGLWFEGAFGYHFYALNSFMVYEKFALHTAHSHIHHPNYRGMLELTAQYLQPDYQVPMLNDTSYDHMRSAYRLYEFPYRELGGEPMCALLNRLYEKEERDHLEALLHYDYYKNTGSHNTVNIGETNQAPVNAALRESHTKDGVVYLHGEADWTQPYQMPDSFTIVQWSEDHYRTVKMERWIAWAKNYFAEVFWVTGVDGKLPVDWVMHFSGEEIREPEAGDKKHHGKALSEEKPYRHIHNVTECKCPIGGEAVLTAYQDGDVITRGYGMGNGQKLFSGKGPDNPSTEEINYRIERTYRETALFAHVIESTKDGENRIRNVRFILREGLPEIEVTEENGKKRRLTF